MRVWQTFYPCVTDSVSVWQILRKANKSKMTDEEIRALAEQIDMNSDGQIDVNEFLEAFTLVFRKQKEWTLCATQTWRDTGSTYGQYVVFIVWL